MTAPATVTRWCILYRYQDGSVSASDVLRHSEQEAIDHARHWSAWMRETLAAVEVAPVQVPASGQPVDCGDPSKKPSTAREPVSPRARAREATANLFDQLENRIDGST